ncbi:MAG: GumC family protein [Omnitrophica WOR_2 bacterium]
MNYNDDEIDLRPYIRQIIRKGWMIILLGIIFAGLAYFYSRKQPKLYNATSIVLLTRSRPTLNLAQQFPTISDPVDIGARLNAILTLIQSDTVVNQVSKDLGKSSASIPSSLLSLKNSILVSSKGDAILIAASSADPNTALQIANIWATDSVRIINQAYNREQPLSDIQNQIGDAQQQYKNAQEELETFIAGSQIDFIKQNILESTELVAKLDGDRISQIDYYSARAQSMQETIAQAEALKKQLAGSDSSNASQIADALGVINIRALALGIITEKSTNNLQVSEPRSTFNMQISDLKNLIDSKDKYSAELDTIIQIAQVEQEKANNELNTLAKNMVAGKYTPMRQEAAAQLSNLEKLLESQQTKQKELTTKRDTALNAYQALLQKQTEIMNGPQAGNEVNVASLAITPVGPISQNTTRNMLLAGVLGIMVGILGVVGLEWWRSANIMGNHERFSTGENIPESIQPLPK